MGRWEKGESGNPSGRPKAALGTSISKELRKQLADTDPSTGRLNIEVIVAAAIRRGKRGEPHALAFIADRTEGKPVQQLNVDANINATREQRQARLEELLTVLAPTLDDEHSDPQPN